MQRKLTKINILLLILTLIVVVIAVIQLSVPLTANQLKLLVGIDTVIWLVFLTEYIFRLIHADSKKTFILNNKVDLLAIIPFGLLGSMGFSSVFKLLRVLYIFKGLVYVGRFLDVVDDMVKTNSFHYILVATMTIILLGAFSISMVEGMKFSDAIWWSFVTTTTVGYGDISPSTGLGRFIASLLMLVGIGFIGLLTGTISSYFVSKNNNLEDGSYASLLLEDILTKLKDFDTLTQEDIDTMYNVLTTLKKEKVN